ncbi:PREDICTED: uncharacterized protein LOC108547610 [Eufriesea mexicana]|uniref:uncharacterized protein LOC108547610 n=1 Tax=Eufriesea mexicana TaxID=516756 RepID=UPI00083C1B80|nr:PREDICTED: uncharacterized protein LOC108547610 [Eufriesea mexicana]
METMQDSGGLHVDGSKGSVASGLPSSKTANQLKIVESCDESGKLLTATKSEMDPYKELELYLAKVNEEIGEIIESAPTTPLIVADEPKYPTEPTPVQQASYASELCNAKSLSAKSCGFRRQNSAGRSSNAAEDIGDWSNSILAEFNTIIANEIDELTKELERKRKKEERRIVQYKELLNEFGISDSESSAGSSCEASTDRSSSRPNKENRDRRNGKLFSDETGYRFLLSSDYDEPRDRVVSAENERRKSGSLPEDLQRVFVARGRYPELGDVLNSDYDEPNNSPAMSFVDDHGQIDRNTSSLPSKLDRGHVQKYEEGSRAKYLGNSYDQPKKHVEISSKTNEDVDEKRATGPSRIGPGSRLGIDADKTIDDSNAKLPPRQRSDAHRKSSLPVNLAIQKRRRTPRLARIRRADEQNAMDPEYDLDEDKIPVGPRSLDGNGPKSAPVTPTEEKKSPFSKFLWKKHTPVFHENTEDVVLVRVSSLPDQDFLQLDNDTDGRSKNGRSDSKDSLSKKRAVSPLTLRSDISAKRLSESDKDVRQVSPVDLKKFSLSRSRGNDVGVNCDLPEDDNAGSIGSVDSGKFDRVENVDVKKILDEQNSRSGSKADDSTLPVTRSDLYFE